MVVKGALTADNGGASLIAKNDVTLDGVVHTNNNLKVKAGQDVVVKGALTADDGGVSLIAENGSISTDSSILKVAITGYSGQNKGVDLPVGSGKAAIVIKSADSLVLHTDAVLTAKGVSSSVDDRSDIVFNAGPPNGGDPIDVAIYVQSSSGNLTIKSSNISAPPEGTVVFDAYDSVYFT